MNLPIHDSRNLAVALLDPASGQWYDWAADQLSPFDPAKHLRAAAPIKVQAATPAPTAAAATWTPPPGLFGSLRNADVGAALQARPNLVPVWFQADGSGNPQSIVDVWPNPFPTAWPVVSGGWSR